jgi:putative phage-type endonuclease
MTAVLIPTASEAEWLAARRQGVTASEIAVLMGLSPWDSPYALYHRKRGELPGQEDNMAMAIGRHFEDFVAGQFAELHPELYVHGDGRALWKHADRPWQMATPDRRVTELVDSGSCTCGADSMPGYGHERHCGLELGDDIAVLECKTDGGFDGWGEDGTDEIPVHYRCQVLWQMDVLGVTTGFVACLFMNRRQLRVYELTMDDSAQADLKVMRSAARRFLERIDHGDAPGVDWRPATTGALKHLHPDVQDTDVPISSQLAGWYMAACRNLKAAEHKRDAYANRIRAVLGNGHRAFDPDRNGQVIARRDVYDVPAKTIERKAFTVDKLVPVKPKEPK